MAKIRALTDLNIKGFAVPWNRVATVDDDVARLLIDGGSATDDTNAIEQALLMNPEIIELADPNAKPAAEEAKPAGKKAKPAPVEQATPAPEESATPAPKEAKDG